MKKLIATCYTGSPIANQQLSIFDILGDVEKNENKPYKAIVTTVYDKTGDGGVDMLDVAELFKSGENQLTELKGDGDFRSPECLALMDEADIVVTNPPFSLFREYVATLMEKEKQFIIVGNKAAVTYKEFFPLIMADKVWVGVRDMNKDFWLYVPRNESYEKLDENGKPIKHIMACWFTNLDIKKRHEEMILVRRYNPEEYPKYINYDAIDVAKVSDIPCDYDGLMGVPVTFLDKYSPEQFEIIGISSYLAKPMKECAEPGTFQTGGLKFYTTRVTEKDKAQGYLYHREYDRIVIRNKHPEAPKEG